MQISGSSDPRSSHARWRSISQRDPAAHCSFLYGVTSTKIYCRPTCSARLARRANVVYYDTIKQAQSDGFRPCFRCKPDDLTFLGQREEVVSRTLALLRTTTDDTAMKGGVKQLAKEVGVTPSYLCRVFKKTMGVTLGEYVRQFEEVPRMDHAMNSTSSARSPKSATVVQEKVAPMPVATAISPPVPLEGWPVSSSDPALQASKSFEEAIDLDFNFDEWLWTEGFDFNNWHSGVDSSTNGIC